MAVTNADIQSWFASNPGASDVEIAKAMNSAGVTPTQLSGVWGDDLTKTIYRYNAANRQIGGGAAYQFPGGTAVTTPTATPTLTADIARDLMQRSMTTGVPTSEFDKYGGYDKVAGLYQSGGGQYSLGAIPTSDLERYAQQVASSGVGNMSLLPMTNTKLTVQALANMGANGIGDVGSYANQYGIQGFQSQSAFDKTKAEYEAKLKAAAAGGGMGSAVTPPTYAPIMPSTSVADYGIGLLPGETTYKSPIGTIAGGATFLAPQYSKPLPAGVANYESVTSAPRVTAEIAGLPRWVQERVSSGPDFSKKTTGTANFKKGGLARFADGGQFSDDLIDQQQSLLRDLGARRSATPPQLMQQAMEQRDSLLGRIQASPAYQPMPEPSTAQQIGEAMMRAGSKGPANIGQLIGRSGSEYFDAQKERAVENAKRAHAGLTLEEHALLNPSMSATALKSANGPTPEQVRTVYQTSLNKNAQIAKEQGPWQSAEARNAWIRKEAEKDVELFLNRFSISGGVPRGEQGAMSRSMDLQAPGAKPVQQAGGKSFPPSMSAAMSAPPARKPAEEARQKTFATGSEELAMKDYSENIAPAAKVADNMLGVVNTLHQIPYTQDLFAPWREKVGAGFDALGMDGKLVREAQNIKQVMPLLTRLANDRLLLAKGVQTEGDAQRAFNEFIKITDPKEAADFLYGWTKELANRAKFKNELYRASKDREGTWQKGEEYWNKSDYAQTPPMAILKGKPWSFSDWRDKFLQANAKKGATIKDAMEAWNNLTRGE